MKRLIFASLLLALPLAAAAQQPHCEHSAPRELQLDLSGVRTIAFEIGPHKLRLDAAPGADGKLQGRACASSQDLLQNLIVEQGRSGHVLTVSLRRDPQRTGWIGRHYSYLDLSGSVPDDVLVQLKVGSGDAWLTGASAMSADVGSGDVDARRIAGQATVKVSSGDVELQDVGSLNVLSIGSGDVEAGNVRGAVEVGSIGSGDFDLKGAGGDVKIGSIGSGDAELQDVRGNVEIGSIGSGDARVRGLGGSLTVNSIGSGDLDARNVRGDLNVRSKGSGSVRHADVGGRIDVPGRR